MTDRLVYDAWRNLYGLIGIIVVISTMDSFIKEKIIYPLSRKHQFGYFIFLWEGDIDSVLEEVLELYPRYSWLYDTEKLFPVHKCYYNNYLLAPCPRRRGSVSFRNYGKLT